MRPLPAARTPRKSWVPEMSSSESFRLLSLGRRRERCHSSWVPTGCGKDGSVNLVRHAALSSGTSCPARTTAKASTTAGSNWVPASCGVRRGCLGREWRAVGAVGRHRVEGVDDGDDACADRDLVEHEAVGVAVAVGPLVGRADDRCDRCERRGGGDDPLADRAVPLHERALGCVERAWLVEDRGRDRRLADVVELGRERVSSTCSAGRPRRDRGALGERGDVPRWVTRFGPARSEPAAARP